MQNVPLFWSCLQALLEFPCVEVQQPTFIEEIGNDCLARGARDTQDQMRMIRGMKKRREQRWNRIPLEVFLGCGERVLCPCNWNLHCLPATFPYRMALEVWWVTIHCTPCQDMATLSRIPRMNCQFWVGFCISWFYFSRADCFVTGEQVAKYVSTPDSCSSQWLQQPTSGIWEDPSSDPCKSKDPSRDGERLHYDLSRSWDIYRMIYYITIFCIYCIIKCIIYIYYMMHVYIYIYIIDRRYIPIYP